MSIGRGSIRAVARRQRYDAFPGCSGLAECDLRCRLRPDFFSYASHKVDDASRLGKTTMNVTRVLIQRVDPPAYQKWRNPISRTNETQVLVPSSKRGGKGRLTETCNLQRWRSLAVAAVAAAEQPSSEDGTAQ